MTAPLPTLDPAFFDAAQTARAWPFEEARKLVARLERSGKKEALFETGYGPSGLPHIGTFGEVARTTMVRTAFRLLTRDEIPTRLICFSDDMDGMRKIPDNVPSRAFLEPYLQMPLTSVPDPWTNEFTSFGAHNNAMLRRFLDTFGFNYEFASATEYYKSGKFDHVLRLAAERATERENGDAIQMREADVAQRGRNPARLVELGRLGHRSRRVDEQIDRQVLLLVEQTQEQPVQTLIGLPVDVPEVVARRVLPVIGELEPAATLAREPIRPILARKRLLRDDVQVLELLEKVVFKSQSHCEKTLVRSHEGHEANEAHEGMTFGLRHRVGCPPTSPKPIGPFMSFTVFMPFMRRPAGRREVPPRSCPGSPVPLRPRSSAARGDGGPAARRRGCPRPTRTPARA